MSDYEIRTDLPMPGMRRCRETETTRELRSQLRALRNGLCLVVDASDKRRVKQLANAAYNLNARLTDRRFASRRFVDEHGAAKFGVWCMAKPTLERLERVLSNPPPPPPPPPGRSVKGDTPKPHPLPPPPPPAPPARRTSSGREPQDDVINATVARLREAAKLTRPGARTVTHK